MDRPPPPPDQQDPPPDDPRDEWRRQWTYRRLFRHRPHRPHHDDWSSMWRNFYPGEMHPPFGGADHPGPGPRPPGPEHGPGGWSPDPRGPFGFVDSGLMQHLRWDRAEFERMQRDHFRRRQETWRRRGRGLFMRFAAIFGLIALLIVGSMAALALVLNAIF